MDACRNVLLEIFGHSAFRGEQEEVIKAAVLGSDVLVVAPTGMGKSLCFQVPAVASERGVTLVVSPLLALMKNQVTKLHELGISVASLTSETPFQDKPYIVQDLCSGETSTRLLYVSPEKFTTTEFRRIMVELHKNGELNRLVVDEAHCISEWGHDFREDYRKLGSFRAKFPDIPIMALTATATENVQRDIIRSLRIDGNRLFVAKHPFNRANLYYELRYTSSPNPNAHMVDIYEFIDNLHRRRGRASSGIVYCRTRNTCDDLAKFLQGKGLQAKAYHRGLKNSVLDKTFKQWVQGGDGNLGGVDVVCATVAFGMGIDKADVRYIVHYDLPKSFEAYYQETGRAGRDGSPAKCVLFYSREDVVQVKRLVSDTHSKRIIRADSGDGPEPSQRAADSLSSLIEFAENVHTCRHVLVCRFFGEKIDLKDPAVTKQYCDQMCDVCKYPNKVKQRKGILTRHEDMDAPSWRPGAQARASVDERGGRTSDPVRKPGSVSGSTTSLKRTDNSAGSEDRGGSHGAWKRVKTEPPVIPLINSARLQKKFKTPFKVPFKTPFETAPGNDVSRAAAPPDEVETAPLPAAYPNDEDEERRRIDDEHERNWTDQQRETQPDVRGDAEVDHSEESDPTTKHSSQSEDLDVARPSSPATVPETDVELDAPYSQKIPMNVRQEHFAALHKALHKVFPTDNGSGTTTAWSRLKMSLADSTTKNEVLSAVARELEFSVHVLCRTTERYQTRAAEKVKAVKMLATGDAWTTTATDDEVVEEAREVVEIVRQVCQKKRRKGKEGDSCYE